MHTVHIPRTRLSETRLRLCTKPHMSLAYIDHQRTRYWRTHEEIFDFRRTRDRNWLELTTARKEVSSVCFGVIDSCFREKKTATKLERQEDASGKTSVERERRLMRSTSRSVKKRERLVRLPEEESSKRAGTKT